MRREAKRFENRISFTWYNDLSFEEILKRAAALPPQSAIFWHLMNVDAAGVVHEGDRALTRLHAVANAPIFSHNDAFFGRAIVGGPMHSVSEGSRLTASVAIRILGGERAGDIKVPATGFAVPKFDWREMRAEIRIADGGRTIPIEQLFFGHDVGPGVIYQDANIKVTTIENTHFAFHKGAA